MGPLRLIDEIGVDVTINIGNTTREGLRTRDHVFCVLLWSRDGQMLGSKTGARFLRIRGKDTNA